MFSQVLWGILKFESHSAFSYWASVWEIEWPEPEGSNSTRVPWSTSQKHEVKCEFVTKVSPSCVCSLSMSILIHIFSK